MFYSECGEALVQTVQGAEDTSSLEAFKARVDGALSSWVAALPKAGVWD